MKVTWKIVWTTPPYLTKQGHRPAKQQYVRFTFSTGLSIEGRGVTECAFSHDVPSYCFDGGTPPYWQFPALAEATREVSYPLWVEAVEAAAAAVARREGV